MNSRGPRRGYRAGFEEPHFALKKRGQAASARHDKAKPSALGMLGYGALSTR
jgi:hypothetical protein